MNIVITQNKVDSENETSILKAKFVFQLGYYNELNSLKCVKKMTFEIGNDESYFDIKLK